MNSTALRCYVSMPYGKRPSPTGETVDFDSIYFNLIAPTVRSLGVSCARGDDCDLGANIQKGLIGLAVQSDLMIADITTNSPNVMYDVGIRFSTHATRTVLLSAGLSVAPFVLASVPRVQYRLADGQPDPVTLEADRARLATVLRRAIESPSTTSPVFDFFPRMRVHLPRDTCVFIGHGRSPLWQQLRSHLEDHLKLKTVSYESESQVGLSIVHILENMLARASFAVLVMTAEDSTSDNTRRARQNVVHEAGLFQGHLGFSRAIVLRQEGAEEFSNIAGLQHIAFHGEAIDQAFPELERVLKREGMIASDRGEA